MIVTGPEIIKAQADGRILISPFDVSNVNPNSYNYHLGKRLICVEADRGGQKYTHFRIPDNGCILNPGILYLGSTAERIGSSSYAVTLLGRSSIGRLGIFLTATADLGHVGSDSCWTLEISVVQPVKVYPHMRIGQVAFWKTVGNAALYHGRYWGDTMPQPCKDPELCGAMSAVEEFQP